MNCCSYKIISCLNVITYITFILTVPSYAFNVTVQLLVFLLCVKRPRFSSYCESFFVIFVHLCNNIIISILLLYLKTDTGVSYAYHFIIQ
jgi:hypothetical protein